MRGIRQGPGVLSCRDKREAGGTRPPTITAAAASSFSTPSFSFLLRRPPFPPSGPSSYEARRWTKFAKSLQDPARRRDEGNSIVPLRDSASYARA